ncbi:GIY-YIG nuclease family protein [Nostocaceae cyanobacterium CENA369]|uniref:GIY-YIG nuclease family protein n=1 Tax=Dendronalium phyllosphericum CENA369 TaxID=1725256 RepID=A0A8J7I1I1_9NOST|nr:GIY-YIG nuclease family protein [Dendronalium phyllosphericum]MBH8574334.1 GIY-YIG nuclease family protein [Dendronalium phyllosphericum CENA369]
MVCGIYQIINTVNGKSYIGQSRNIYRRWRQHTGGLNRQNPLETGNYPLRAAFLKYQLQTVASTPGMSGVFEFKIIERCTEDKLLERERFWIEKIKPKYNCNTWTPLRRRVRNIYEQKFWVQYHNYDNLGYVPGDSIIDDYGTQEEFGSEDLVSCISTNKRSILNAQGDTVFLIVGIGVNPKQYYLWSKLIIEEVEIADEYGAQSYHGFGNGWLMNSPVLLNSIPFNQFKSYCGNFGFGFMSIRDNSYLSHLKDLSETNRLGVAQINFDNYINDFYNQVIHVNPKEERRLFG